MKKFSGSRKFTTGRSRSVRPTNQTRQNNSLKSTLLAFFTKKNPPYKP